MPLNYLAHTVIVTQFNYSTNYSMYEMHNLSTILSNWVRNT